MFKGEQLKELNMPAEENIQITIDKELTLKIRNFIWGNDPANNCHSVGCGQCQDCKIFDELTDWVDGLPFQ